MTRTIRNLALLIPVFAVLGGCATSERWSQPSGDRDNGIVKLSYEYDDAIEPTLSRVDADRIAENRCKSWGFQQASLIPGDVRSCSNETGNRCELWKVTREYQCQSGGSLVLNLSP
jgi:hypothetical protein